MSANHWSMDVSRYETLAAKAELEILTRDDARSVECFRALQALRSATLEAGVTSLSVPVWATRAYGVEMFYAKHGQRPVENNRRPNSPHRILEHSLAAWLRNEALPATKCRRCSFQLDWLNSRPTPRVPSHARRWFMHRNEYWAFNAGNGYSPSVGSASRSERHLAAWGAKQRLKYRKECLKPYQVRMLNDVPGWVWGRTVALSSDYSAQLMLSPSPSPSSTAKVNLADLDIVLPVPPEMN